ncbi:MAG: hypothetical protein CMM49_01790 [Rhodospirillaceae bacterium]|nr:hypothetical protein [Rhodospirillaceae bacterium]|tara:strand:+ start:502 stop:1458 length:957 start_codon:yes stop_codon:yes gene_type:complete
MQNFKIHSLLYLTISCSEKKSLENILLNGLGWELYSKSNISKELINQINYKKNLVDSELNIFRSPNSKTGMIRVLEGDDRIREKQRSLRWGGFEVVVMYDIDKLFNKLLNFDNFIPISPPENYDFTDVNSNIHRAFSAILPGGTHATFTMKITEPKNRLFPKSGSQVGHIFEIPLNTSDYIKTKKFYEEDLGLIKILEAISNNGPLHKSWKIPVGENYSLGIFKSSGSNSGLGSIEIHGCRKIFLDKEIMFDDSLDGGACIVTFAVNNIIELHKYLKILNMKTSPVIKLKEAPYNGNLTFIVYGPNNEKIEFIDFSKT